MHDQHPVLTDDKKKELLHTFRQSLEDVPDSHRFTDTVRDHHHQHRIIRCYSL